MVVIDSCVWIEYFRSGQGPVCDLVDQLIDQNRAISIGIIELELFQGAFVKERKVLSDLFRELHYLELDRDDFNNTGKMLYDLRKKGITIPPSDGLIAVACIGKGYKLLTFDRHFSHIDELQLVPIVD